MSKVRFLLPILLVLVLFGTQKKTFAQSEPVLYFCEKYDDDKGEIGVSDRFTTGYLTVVVKCSKALGLKDCHIQFDKYDWNEGKFVYYKKFNYEIKKSQSYVFFSKNDESDLSFEKPGIYRVYLLDDDDKTVACSLVQIIPRD